MKKLLILLAVIPLALITFQNCSTTVDNRLTFQNLASNDVYINFRATLTHVPAGQTVELTEIPKGSFDYETTYEVPVNATSSKTEGAVSGTLDIKAGTKILIVYSSIIVEGEYILSASISNSDDINEEDINPIGP